MGLKEAKDLVEKVPVVVKRELLKRKLMALLRSSKNWVLLWYLNEYFLCIIFFHAVE